MNAPLGLLRLALAFWVVFASLLGGLAAGGHCIDAAWSLTPVCGGRFWWTVVTSPELLIFVFFMITDPRTVPAGGRSRLAFGAAVGYCSVLLLAPQTTEFGAKVGLLGGLVPAVDPSRVPTVIVDEDAATAFGPLIGPDPRAVGLDLLLALDGESLALGSGVEGTGTILETNGPRSAASRFSSIFTLRIGADGRWLLIDVRDR